jgi:EF hand
LWPKTAVIFVLAATLTPLPVLAEVALSAPTQTQADLDLIQSRAKGWPGLPDLPGQLSDATIGIGNVSLQGMIVTGTHRGAEFPPEGFPYGTLRQLDVAQNRAEYLKNILSSDLNGDGSVSRNEISTLLEMGYGRESVSPKVLITEDIDLNDVLSPEEIQAAVIRHAGAYEEHSTYLLGAELLDLNSDGTLTQEEFRRGEEALRLFATK